MEKNSLRLLNIKVSGNTVEYEYEVRGEWRRFFIMDAPFAITYDIPLDKAPQSILAIPFLCNVLPAAWISDAQISLEECDRDFYDSIPDFKRGYIDMYPMLTFGGGISAARIVGNGGERQGCASLFSGGVDATHTMISHYDEKPALITVWGADITLADEPGWNRVYSQLSKIAEEYGLKKTAIKSALREVLDAGRLSDAVAASCDNWWHGFQHGIALIGHTAPYLYLTGLKTLYIASSFNAGDKNVKGASYPTIDNHVRFCGCNTVHDAFECTRQDKIGQICDYSRQTNTKMNLRVCWQSAGGGNCCRCEKCYRTMLAILAEGESPDAYGFEWNSRIRRRLKYNLLWRIPLTEPRYMPIIKRLRETRVTKAEIAEWGWLMNSTVEKLNRTAGKRIWRAFSATALWRALRPFFVKSS